MRHNSDDYYTNVSCDYRALEPYFTDNLCIYRILLILFELIIKKKNLNFNYPICKILFLWVDPIEF